MNPAKRVWAIGIVLVIAQVSWSQIANDPPELKAIFNGVQGIEDFARRGGRFTGEKNVLGQTAAMLSAGRGAKVIEAFSRAGGKFTQEIDNFRYTAAIYVVNGCNGENPPNRWYQSAADCPANIEAFARAGGKFVDGPDSASGMTPAMKVAMNPKAILAFAKAGGHFTNFRLPGQYTAAMYAAMHGADSIRAFSEAGGKFTTQKGPDGTAANIAAERGDDALQAYMEAVVRQGGLVHVSEEEERSFRRNAIASRH
jgi:hypothetical protein